MSKYTITDIYCNNIDEMFDDNLRCLMEGNKVEKRIKRGKLMSWYTKKEFHDEKIKDELREGGLPIEGDKPPTFRDMFRHLPTKTGSGFTKLGNGDKPKEKVFIEGVMTNKINDDGVIFNEMTGVIDKLIGHIKDSSVGGYLESGDVVCVMKGGMVSRKVLLETHPEDKEKIEDAFGYGDCDFGFLVDKNIKNPDEVCSFISDLSYETLKDFDYKKLAPNTLKKITQLKSVDVLGTKLHVSHVKTRHFRRVCKDQDDESSMLSYDNDDLHDIRATTNHIKGEKTEFYLTRLKTSFRLSSLDEIEGALLDGIAAAEVLDVSTSICDLKEVKKHLMEFGKSKYMPPPPDDSVKAKLDAKLPIII